MTTTRELAVNHIDGALRVAVEAHALVLQGDDEAAAVEAQLATVYALTAIAGALLASSE